MAVSNDIIAEKREILFIDDDPLIVESLSIVLQEEFDVFSAESRDQTKNLIQKLGHTPSLALIDLGLPPFPHTPDEGFKLINELLIFNPNIKILVLSGQSDTANIHHAMTLGAVDFVPKPCDIPLLKSRLDHQSMMLEAEHAQGGGETSGESLLGESQAIKTLHSVINQFADTPYPVLVEGESGSGKELVAKFIHEKSNRASAPFLTINCAAFSKELLEAQLFGHAKGAFTGATKSHNGFFEDAGEGSLVLDEIGELHPDLQSNLLRVLENGEYYRVGETQVRKSNARIIAATNRELREEIRTGRFRQDLYHRLSVLTIKTPPLRERDNDSLILLDHFKKMYAINNQPFELDQEAQQCIQEYPFPGNVRELRNIVIRLSAKHPGKTVSLKQFEEELELSIPSFANGTSVIDDESVQQDLIDKSFRLEERINEWEKKYISAALEMTGGNLSKTARILGVNRTTLYSRIQRLSIKNTG